MCAKDGGEFGGGKPPTLEDQLTQLRADLSAAQASITSLTSERDTARTDLTAAQAEVTRLTAQFTALTTTATAAQADVMRLTGELSAMTTARDTVARERDTATTNVSRLEALCGVKGIDPKAAVPHVNEPEAKASIADLTAEMQAAKTPEARAAVAAKAAKALAPKAAA